ncbi:hypothetical protein [Streptomyces sp. NPDC096030]|uniref:hypothetical protein n=1 Tax=Streptomyces sp. NPDC096030 TaxID=3155423 RepID=UPI00333485CF
MSKDALETAQREYQSAQEALHAARRTLAAAVLDAYANGEPVGRIAGRTGQSTASVWNTSPSTASRPAAASTAPPDSRRFLPSPAPQAEPVC